MGRIGMSIAGGLNYDYSLAHGQGRHEMPDPPKKQSDSKTRKSRSSSSGSNESRDEENTRTPVALDPGRRFYFDQETGTINVNLEDMEAMELASTQFVLNEQRGYTRVVAIDSKGNMIIFNNAEAMVNFVEDNQDFSSVENFIATAGVIVSGAYVPLEILRTGTKLADNMGTAGNVFTGAAFLIDLGQAIDNPNIDTISDLVITGIGFAGPEGAVISIGLSYTKKGVMTAAGKMADFSMNFEKAYINSVSQSFFGIDIKR